VAWFRSETDFDDWLKNPNYERESRSKLVKVAVNLAEDLFKPHVVGYQVTQRRKKKYSASKEVIYQFTLERHMDDGPPIEIVFGAHGRWKADILRESLIECMRNTPMKGGDIYPTGAV